MMNCESKEQLNKSNKSMLSTLTWSPNLYLEPDLQVLTQLRAAAQFTVQAFINEAVQLIRTVATVIIVIAQ